MALPDSTSDPTVSALRRRFAGSTGEIFLRRLGALDFVQFITAFGAVLLLSALPYVILMSSLANHRIDTDLSRHIGLNSQGADIVSRLFRSSPADSTANIVIALVVAVAGTLAVANSLQVIYEQAFGQEHRGWRDVLRYLTWVGVLFGVLVAETVISNPVHVSLGPVGEGLVSYAGAAAFFWWTMYFLLARRVPGRMLARPALLTALFWICLEFVSSAYFSSAIISDNRLYGAIGVVFSLLTWFIAIGAVIVLGAAAGATWEQRKGRLADPKAGGPKAGGPKAGGPKAGGPKAGGPKAGGPKAGGPKAGGPKAGGPKAGGPKAGGPKAGGPKAGGPKAGGPKAGGRIETMPPLP